MNPIASALVAALALAALGCETPLERAYGRSQHAYLERSIENPEAGTEEEGPRVGGVSAANAVAKMRRHENVDQTEVYGTDSIINVEIGN